MKKRKVLYFNVTPEDLEKSKGVNWFLLSKFASFGLSAHYFIMSDIETKEIIAHEHHPLNLEDFSKYNIQIHSSIYELMESGYENSALSAIINPVEVGKFKELFIDGEHPEINKIDPVKQAGLRLINYPEDMSEKQILSGVQIAAISAAQFYQ